MKREDILEFSNREVQIYLKHNPELQEGKITDIREFVVILKDDRGNKSKIDFFDIAMIKGVNDGWIFAWVRF